MMKIEERKIITFVFPWMVQGFEQRFDVPGFTKEEAAQHLKEWLSKVQTELSMEFPTSFLTAVPLVLPDMNEGFNELQTGVIDSLMKDISQWRMLEKDRNTTIQKWVEIEPISVNFKGIVDALEALKSTYSSQVKKLDSTHAEGEIISSQPKKHGKKED